MKLILSFLILSASLFSQAAKFDMSRFSSLSGAKGEGTNSFVPGEVECSVIYDSRHNTLAVDEDLPWHMPMKISGNNIEKIKTEDGITHLTTGILDSRFDNFCGMFIPTRNLIVTAAISEKHVSITRDFTCGYRQYKENYRCQLH